MGERSPLGNRAGMHLRLHVRFRMGMRRGGGGERVLRERRPRVSCDVMRINDGLAIRNVDVASGSKMRDEGARSSVHTLPYQGKVCRTDVILCLLMFFVRAHYHITVSAHKNCTKESPDP